jgi:tRNA nucleotidyltransferase (CCA-adding enzyme)
VNSERARERIAHFRTHWRELKPLLDGKRLQQLGIVPGPIYRQILEAVRSAHLDAEISASEDAEQLALTLANHASRRSNDHIGN